MRVSAGPGGPAEVSLPRERHLLSVRARGLDKGWVITELGGGSMRRFNQPEFVPLLEEVVLLCPCVPNPHFCPYSHFYPLET